MVSTFNSTVGKSTKKFSCILAKLFGTQLDFKIFGNCSQSVQQVESDRQSSHPKSSHTNIGIAQESRIDACPIKTQKSMFYNFQVHMPTLLTHLQSPSTGSTPTHKHPRCSVASPPCGIPRPTVHLIHAHPQPECRDMAVKYTPTGIRSWGLD